MVIIAVDGNKITLEMADKLVKLNSDNGSIALSTTPMDCFRCEQFSDCEKYYFENGVKIPTCNFKANMEEYLAGQFNGHCALCEDLQACKDDLKNNIKIRCVYRDAIQYNQFIDKSIDKMIDLAPKLDDKA